jgi:hypothetical protein
VVPTESTSAKRGRKPGLEPPAKRPRYTRGLLWDDEDDVLSATAQYSLTATPVPRVPIEELTNKALMNTISSNPTLFKVDCKINVDRFHHLLRSHPNQPFVESVCHSLREGFWPWANTRIGVYPETWDFSDRPSKRQEHIDFIATQVDTEVRLGRYSEAFGPNLLPGMYSSPIHAVDKPGTTTFRLINDQSAGEFSPNSMIATEDVAGTCMDTIKSLGASLRAFRKANGDDVQLVMWKSDIEAAYRNLWLVKQWQAKQTVTLGDKRHVDHCNCFGNRSSYKIFLSFYCLVAWIAEYIKLIRHLKTYVDDNASFGLAGDVLYYEPYHRYYPTNQTKLLLLWDELGIPHAEKKQIYGPVVPFIGFDVDPNTMTVSISDERRAQLIEKVRTFAKPGQRHSLRDFQSLAGHINWSLAVFPLLRPSLSAIYDKISGKNLSLAPIRVNNAICEQLQWFIGHVRTSDGIFLLKTVAWDPTTELTNTTICFADACLGGMAFWYPELKLGYQCRVPSGHVAPIFYWEAVAVACAMLAPPSLRSPRLVVNTDNQNTVDIWHSLKASSPYNSTLVIAIDSLIEHRMDARVLHVPGVENPVADALSRFNNALALRLVPGIKVGLFEPPRLLLGAVQK